MILHGRSQSGAGGGSCPPLENSREYATRKGQLGEHGKSGQRKKSAEKRVKIYACFLKCLNFSEIFNVEPRTQEGTLSHSRQYTTIPRSLRGVNLPEYSTARQNSKQKKIMCSLCLHR